MYEFEVDVDVFGASMKQSGFCKSDCTLVVRVESGGRGNGYVGDFRVDSP